MKTIRTFKISSVAGVVLSIILVACNPSSNCKQQCNTNCNNALSGITKFFESIIASIFQQNGCQEVCTMRIECVKQDGSAWSGPCSVNAGLTLDVTTGTGVTETIFDDSFTVGSDGKSDNLPFSPCLSMDDIQGLQVNNSSVGTVSGFVHDPTCTTAPKFCRFYTQSSSQPTIDFDLSTCTVVIKITMVPVGGCRTCPAGC